MTQELPTHIVKLHRYDGSTSVVWISASRDEAELWARELNERYQTDTYRVEPYAPHPQPGAKFSQESA